jgi:hypothetical protein
MRPTVPCHYMPIVTGMASIVAGQQGCPSREWVSLHAAREERVYTCSQIIKNPPSPSH